MEDQQPTAGDLTDAVADAVTDAVDDAVTDTVTDDPAGTVNDRPADDAADTVTDSPAAPPPKRRLRTGTATTVAAAAATFVVSGAFAAGALQPYLVSRANVDIKLDIARTAADTITTLWTYTPEDMDKLPDRAAKYLSGDFQDQYRKFVDAIVATNKQAEVSNQTQVVAAAVESLNGPEASALVYTNTVSSTPKAAIPSMKYISYRLQLKRDGSKWLVTKMTTITSLDLTPKL